MDSNQLRLTDFVFNYSSSSSDDENEKLQLAVAINMCRTQNLLIEEFLEEMIENSKKRCSSVKRRKNINRQRKEGHDRVMNDAFSQNPIYARPFSMPQARSAAVKTETYNQSTAMKEAIVLFPAPGIGHLVSMVELGKLISNHHTHKFSVIILLTTGPFDTAATTAHTHRISQAYPSITFRRFPFVSVDTSPTPSEAAIRFEFIRLNATNVRHALEEISRTSSIRSIIIDFFCSSALPIARNLQIPVYYFFTSGAAALAFYLYFPTLDKQISNSFKDLTATYLQFPGFPPIRASHVPEPLLDRVDPAYANMLYFCQHLAKSDGIIVNTFDALEPLAIETIASGACVPDGKTPPIYYIGPLIANPDEGDGNGGGGGGGTAKQDCLSWLDAQPRRSVVYLCFGSRGTFTTAQLKEIANGLERSGQRFLLVVKPPKQIEAAAAVDVCLEDLLPEGFLERTKEKGMVVKSWAPQVAVLRHKSVGGFVTHCGWNSVLEAVVAGVPMVAWPLYAEQHVNRAVLVEKMKMAIPLKEREEDRFVTAIELEKRVRELMESETGRELRERSWKMREMAIAAMGNSGSSITALANLVELWKQG